MNDYTPEDVEAPFSATFRTGAGYDAALLTVRGNDPAQFVARLTELQLEDQDVLKLVADFNRTLQEKAGGGADQQPAGNNSRGTGSPSRSGGSSARGGASRPASTDVEYHPEGLTCSALNCGQAIFLKHGTSRAGNKFQVWTCPNQKTKNDGHYSQYV